MANYFQRSPLNSKDLSNGTGAWNAGRHNVCFNADDVGVIL
jgi:hypothetical protein